jgi:TetR/AcrR family transcriptional regulator, transcriptional repressor for nem operon
LRGESTKKGGRTEKDTRKKLIMAARELFLERGYEAVSIADILKKSGVNSGSLYYFFRTKEDLLLAVLDWYLENLHPQVIDPAKQLAADPIEQVFAVLAGYRQMLTVTGCQIGCPIGNLALEMSEKSEAVRAKIAQNFENWRAAIRNMLVAAKDRLPGGSDCDALATFILTVMEGGVMQSRAHRSLDPFEKSISLLRDYVNRLLAFREPPVQDPPPASRPEGWWDELI